MSPRRSKVQIVQMSEGSYRCTCSRGSCAIISRLVWMLRTGPFSPKFCKAEYLGCAKAEEAASSNVARRLSRHRQFTIRLTPNRAEGFPVHCAVPAERVRAGLRNARSKVHKPGRSRVAVDARQRQLDVSYQHSVASPTAYCFLTTILFAVVVSVNPAVTLVNDPSSEPNVRAV